MRLFCLVTALFAQQWEFNGLGPATVEGVGVSAEERRQVKTSWPGNTIYAWFLPSSKAHFSPQEAKAVIAAGNVFLRRMSVMTRLVGLKAAVPIDASTLDNREVIALVGEKQEVLDFARKSSLLKKSDAWVEGNWSAIPSNPELGMKRTKERMGWVLVGASASEGFARALKGKASKVEAAALIIIHGSGHVAGLGHLTRGSFMDDGAVLAANISGESDFVMKGATVSPKQTAIEDLFDAKLFDKLPDHNYTGSYTSEKTQRAVWNRFFGWTAPSPVSEYCSRQPEHCF
jgi:hypothetical protein